MGRYMLSAGTEWGPCCPRRGGRDAQGELSPGVGNELPIRGGVRRGKSEVCRVEPCRPPPPPCPPPPILPPPAPPPCRPPTPTLPALPHLAAPTHTHILLPSHPQLSSTQGVTPDEWQIALATFFLLGRSVRDVIILT